MAEYIRNMVADAFWSGLKIAEENAIRIFNDSPIEITKKIKTALWTEKQTLVKMIMHLKDERTCRRVPQDCSNMILWGWAKMCASADNQDSIFYKNLDIAIKGAIFVHHRVKANEEMAERTEMETLWKNDRHPIVIKKRSANRVHLLKYNSNRQKKVGDMIFEKIPN